MLYIIKDFYIMIFILNGTKERRNVIIVCEKKKTAIKMNMINVKYLKNYIYIYTHSDTYDEKK